MKRIILPEAPRPTSDQNAFNQAIASWIQQSKGIIEQASKINDTPISQPFVVTSGYTLTTSIAGTSTGTQITNFLCSFISAMINKGLITQANINT